MATIKPGLLVALKTSLVGGVSYHRNDKGSKVLDNGAQFSEWDTTKIVDDPAEHERASKARSKASALIRRECCETAFGLLCPEAAESALDAAIVAARAVCDEFNLTAQSCRVSVRALKGRIARTDEEAARTIAADVESILREMEDGIRRVDAAAIRDAAKRATEMGAMLDDSVLDNVQAAVEAARRAARKIVQKVEKEGAEVAEIARDLRIAETTIASQRFAFMDHQAPLAVEALPGVDAQRFADLATGAARVADAAASAADPVAAAPAALVAPRELDVA